MKKKMKMMILALGVTLISGSLYASSQELGSSNDPLVTKSYVDYEISKIKSEGRSANVTSLEAEMAIQSLEIQILKKELESLKTESSSIYEVVTVKSGQSILGGQGTEIIIRSGEGVVLASPAGGLQNMTQGVDIAGGEVAPKYHLFIVPREDGRGLYAKQELVVMVRGAYTILE